MEGVVREARKEEPKRAGIWIRVSTENQARGESPEHHERRARFYAESKGWQVVEVYHLEAVSGKSVMGQPETQRMLGHVKSGQITGLIFSKLARLARNTKELLEFAEFFEKHHADLVSLQEAIDTSTPAGRFFYTVIAAMAQWEREEIADRVAASVPIRAKLGKPLGGAAPFGYRWEDRKLVPDPKEAPVRQHLYELFVSHRRKKTVARLLNEAGYRTRNGSKFTDTTVDRLIRDPTAKGLRRANYTRSLGDKKHWVVKPKDQWVWIDVNPIVSEELWDECNVILEERRKRGERPGRRPLHLFTGLTWCECGQKMYVPSTTPKYVCYRCRNKVPIVDLERVFHEQLRGFFLSPEEIGRYLEESDKTIQEKGVLLASLMEERAGLKAEMDRLYRLYMDGGLTVEGFKSRNQPLEDREKQLSDEVPQLQAEVDFMRIQLLSSSQIVAEAQDLFARWPELEFEDKRKIVENIVERIVVGKGDISLELCYVPSPHEITAERQRGSTDSSPRRGESRTDRRTRRRRARSRPASPRSAGGSPRGRRAGTPGARLKKGLRGERVRSRREPGGCHRRRVRERRFHGGAPGKEVSRSDPLRPGAFPPRSGSG